MEENELLLREWLGRPAKIELLFRASEHNFSAEAFHKKCDKVSSTLVLVRTEFDKTIGGFNPGRWYSRVRGNFMPDFSNKAFIFSLDLKEKFALKDSSEAFSCGQDMGPGFGQDIQITDQCFNSKKSHSWFPSAYDGKDKYQSNQVSHTAFCGNPHGYKFRVIDYEVFRVEERRDRDERNRRDRSRDRDRDWGRGRGRGMRGGRGRGGCMGRGYPGVEEDDFSRDRTRGISEMGRRGRGRDIRSQRRDVRERSDEWPRRRSRSRSLGDR